MGEREEGLVVPEIALPSQRFWGKDLSLWYDLCFTYNKNIFRKKWELLKGLLSSKYFKAFSLYCLIYAISRSIETESPTSVGSPPPLLNLLPSLFPTLEIDGRMKRWWKFASRTWRERGGKWGEVS